MKFQRENRWRTVGKHGVRQRGNACDTQEPKDGGILPPPPKLDQFELSSRPWRQGRKAFFRNQKNF